MLPKSGGILDDEVTSQTQATQSIADKIAKTGSFQMLPRSENSAK
jgi:hypothetical protein